MALSPLSALFQAPVAGVPVVAAASAEGNEEDDLAEMEAFVSDMPAAEGSDVAAAPRLPPAPRTKKPKKPKSAAARAAGETAAAKAEGGGAAARGVTPAIVKSTRGRRTSAETWAKLSDKEKARRESNRRSAQLAKKKKAEEIKQLEESNAATREKIAELDRLLPALTEEARQAAAQLPEGAVAASNPLQQQHIAAAVWADPVLNDLFGDDPQ